MRPPRRRSTRAYLGLKPLRKTKSPSRRVRSVLGLRRAEERRVANENMRLRARVMEVIAESRAQDSPSFFTGFRFEQMGIRREHLLRVGLDIRTLKQMGFNCWFMRWVGFELQDFIREKIPIGFMLSGGFTRGRIESARAWLLRQEKRKLPSR